MPLNSKQKRHLRGLSHKLKPIVTVADKGLSDTVMQEIEGALEFHELMKIKIRAERDERVQMAQQVCNRTRAELVQGIGQTYTLFRRNPDKDKIELPK